MYQMIYVSKASYPMLDGDLEDILISCRSNNLIRRVTGMLLYANQSFIQALEGKESVVKDLYEAIKKDARHNDAEILFEQTLEAREFPDWSMGFKNADDERGEQFNSLFSNNKLIIAAKSEENRAHKILMAFRDRVSEVA